jgi:cation transport ATPase
MPTLESSSSGPHSPDPELDQKPNPADPRRSATYLVEGLSCRHCAKRAANTLRSLPGVLSAKVHYSTATAEVCHDARLTHDREIVTNLAQRGIFLSPSLGGPSNRVSWFDAPRIGIVIALLGNLIALAWWVPARSAPRLPLVELVFAILLFAIASPPLVSHVVTCAKRGIWGTDALALLAACAAIAIGIVGLSWPNESVASTPNFLSRFGARSTGVSALAFESAGAILGFVFLSNQLRKAALRKALANIERSLRFRYARIRRILPGGSDVFVPCAFLHSGDHVRLGPGEVALVNMRLDSATYVATSSGRIEERASGQMLFRGERLGSYGATGCVTELASVDTSIAADAAVAHEARRIEENALRGEGGKVESTAAFALGLATTWFAVFALIVHAVAVRHAVHSGIFLAAVAVVAGASPGALALGLPLARIMAITRARSAGIVIKNVDALEALAGCNFAYFDLSGGVSHDAPRVFRALWQRTIACRIFTSEDPEIASALEHRFGVAVTANITPEEKVRSVSWTRATGERVVHIGRLDTVQMLPVDVSIAVAPNELPDLVAAPIILRELGNSSLVWLFDTARSLRSKTRLLLVMTLGYHALVVPICVAGFLSPLVAGSVNFLFTLLTCALAFRSGPDAGLKLGRDKQTFA